MNQGHRELCASEDWFGYLRDELVPWMLGDRDLGKRALEIGPGPGRSTDLLRSRSASLTAVEPDPAAAAALAGRFIGTNVVVLEADAADLPFDDGRFTGAVAMTMLHHVPTEAAQDALLAEACRVLRPVGWFIGVDSLDDPGFRDFHAGDVCLPVDPDAFEPRLRAAGFEEIEIERGDGAFRFAARTTTKEMTRR